MKNEIYNAFALRANTLSDHDPWRYGGELSEKTDAIELQWIIKNIKNTDSLIDMGCGTGRHVLYLANLFPKMRIHCFDFAENNIKILNKKIQEGNINNIKTEVCDVENFYKIYKKEKFSNILSIGLIQYLLSKKELDLYFKKCFKILNSDGKFFIKNPTAFDSTFKCEIYSHELNANYISLYRNLRDIENSYKNFFNLDKYEEIFNIKNLTEDELVIIEKNNKTRQNFILLSKREKL